METGEQLGGNYNSLTGGNEGYPKPEEVVGVEKEVVVGVAGGDDGRGQKAVGVRDRRMWAWRR